MAFAIHSDDLLLLAQQVALASAGVILLLVLQIVLIRLMRNSWTSRRARVVAVWNPILLTALDGPVPDPLPPLLRRDLEVFLHAWNHHRGLLLGEGGEQLDDLARRLGVDVMLPRMIRSGGIRRRLLAAQTAGNLRDPGSRGALEETLADRDPYLSFTAARSLLRIHPREAVPKVLPLVVGREDWSPSRVSHLLSEVPSALWAGPLIRAIEAAGGGALPRAVEHLVEADPADALPLVRRLLAAEASPALQAACLRVVAGSRDPEDLPLVKARLDHPDPAVRGRAVAAWAAFAGEGEEGEKVLRRMLADREFDVRWEAANGLTILPGMDGKRLRAIAADLGDTFARDMLAQVIAEREFR